jgi:hypothetical protein
MLGLAALLTVAMLTVTGAVGFGAASAAGGPGGPARIRVLGLRAGTVIVAKNRRAASRLRLHATVSILRPVGVLSVQLNGHRVGRTSSRSGRLGLRLDAADGLVVGENLLWVSAGRRGGPPSRVVPVQFVVGYRNPRPLSVHLRLGAGKRPAATATLRVPSAGVQRLKVTLNGVPMRVPPGARLLDLARLGTVRWGSNRLTVRLIMFDGRVADWARTFRLDRRRDVAVARLDGAAVVGRSVVLDARRSLIVPGVRQARGFRWALVRRPLRSHARLGRTRGSRMALRLDVPGDYVVALEAGQGSPGSYDLLDVAATYPAPLVPLDTIKYNISPANTVLPGIQVGNDFYSDPFLFQPSGPAPIQLLVLNRTDLGDVTEGGFTAGSGPDYFSSLKTALQRLNNNTNDLVIITHPAGSPPLLGSTLAGLDSALRVVGGTLPATWNFTKANCWSGQTLNCRVCTQTSCGWSSWQQGAFNGGSFTVVGVPGLTPGQAWRETAAQTGGQVGNIVGYLTKGVDPQGPKYYTVVNGGPGQYAPVDTCAGSSCAVRIGVNVTANVSVGSATITSVTPNIGYANGATIAGPGIPDGATIVSGAGTPTLTISSPATASATAVGLAVDQTYPAGANGLHVVTLDRTTLKPIVNQTVTTTTGLASALTTPGPNATVGHFDSNGIDDQRLVILQSVGSGSVSGAATTALLQDIDELGGTPDLLLSALAGHKYALVGAATNLPWRNSSALESSTDIPATPGSRYVDQNGVIHGAESGMISGAVERDRDGLYAPSGGDAISATNADLGRILYQPAQPWPYAADTEDLKSIAYQLGLTNQAGTTGYPDIRSAYYLNPDGEPWGSLRSDLDPKSNKVVCPHPPDQCGTFEALRKELENEFLWVQEVLKLTDGLLKPYLQSGDSPYFSVQQVTDQVLGSLPQDTSSKMATMKWVTIMSDVMFISSKVSDIAGGSLARSAVFGLFGYAGLLATGVMEQSDSKGGPADQVTTTANNLKYQMSTQQQMYIFWVNQLKKDLLYDYGKLAAVGPAMVSDLAWAFGPDQNTDAITGLNAGAVASAESALLPVAWDGYNLMPDGLTQTSSNDVSALRCDWGQEQSGHQNKPFAGAPPENQFHATSSIASDGSPVNQVWTFAKLDLNSWGNASNNYSARNASLPSASQTDYIYGQYATGHSVNGIYHFGAYQYAPVWWRDTYNPPGFAVCSSGPTLNSWASNPPAISRPLP